MKIKLDCIRVKCRQELLWYVILMIYDMQLRSIRIHPRRNMSPRHKMYLIDPRCKLLDPAEPVLQIVPAVIPRTAVVFYGITVFKAITPASDL